MREAVVVEFRITRLEVMSLFSLCQPQLIMRLHRMNLSNNSTNLIGTSEVEDEAAVEIVLETGLARTLPAPLMFLTMHRTMLVLFLRTGFLMRGDVVREVGVVEVGVVEDLHAAGRHMLTLEIAKHRVRIPVRLNSSNSHELNNRITEIGIAEGAICLIRIWTGAK